MTNKLNVLLVDDNAESLNAIEKVLQHDDIVFLKANSGNRALSILLDNRVALAILDVKMPGMNGFELAELMRSREITQRVPIMFVTGMQRDQQFIFEGYEHGAVDYLLTPVEPVVLKSKVQVFLDLYRARREVEELNDTLEKKVEQRNQELIQKNEDLERFTHIAAHDLQEPLRRMRNALELFQMEASTDINSRQINSINMLDRSCRQMADLVMSFRELTRIGSHQLNRENIGLRRLIETIIDDLKAKRVNFTFGDLPENVYVYSRLVYQLYVNLIENAIKYSSLEMPVVEFTAEKDLDADGDVIVLGVKNNGSTVDIEKRTDVFKLFSKLDKKSGMGIGLSLCKRIAEYHGGKIWIEGGEDHVHVKFILHATSREEEILKNADIK